MKFNEAEQKIQEVEKKNYSKSSGWSSEKSLRSVFRYDNISICLMSPGTKGDLKYLSTLINDGKEQTSWCIRVYYTNSKWGAQIVPNSLIDKLDINISISEIFERFKRYKNLEYNSTLHVGSIYSKDRDVIQKAVISLIKELRDKKLNGTDKLQINTKYTLKNNSKRFLLEYDTSAIKVDDIPTIKKYATIYKKLIEKQLDDIQLKQVDIEKLNINDKEILFNLSRKYLTEHERIQIAMRFML